MNQIKIKKIVGGLITFFTPFVILMLSVRIMITPVFARVEYGMPNFPEDPFGFSLEDRLVWSEPSIKYLVNNEGIEYLQELNFGDGEPVFNERELSHMQDVKAVVTGMRIALTLSLLILLVITIIGIRKSWRVDLLAAYRNGGWALIGLMAAILLFVAISFQNLFTWFHQLFFESGTWQFYTSDTLIRLFPMKFWQDAFIFVGVFSLLIAGLLIFFTRNRKIN